MTPRELYHKWIEDYALGDWPKAVEVDADTYLQVEAAMQEWADSRQRIVTVGPHLGVYFKGVELVCSRYTRPLTVNTSKEAQKSVDIDSKHRVSTSKDEKKSTSLGVSQQETSARNNLTSEG